MIAWTFVPTMEASQDQGPFPYSLSYIQGLQLCLTYSDRWSAIKYQRAHVSDPVETRIHKSKKKLKYPCYFLGYRKIPDLQNYQLTQR
jgi:hypothetical protein